jgi:hypothetical protein
MPLDPGEPLWVRVGRAPVHASRCQREARFSGPVTSLADFCNRIRRVGTPDERPILARERGFRSAAHRQVMPAALAVRCVCTHRKAREPRPVRAMGRSVRVKESAQPSANDFARPSSWNSRHPGRRYVRRAGTGASRKRGAPTEIRVRCRFAKAIAHGGSRRLPPRRNSYANGGLLLRARLNRGSVTPPPQRHCSGARTPF